MEEMIMSRAIRLGATLYMPVINPHAAMILAGEEFHDAGSVVLCLEDALHENDIQAGMAALVDGLRMRNRLDCRNQKLMIFVRPRHLEMARQIARFTGIDKIAGMIVPKITLENGPEWFALARDFNIPLMPTLETSEYFDAGYVSRMRELFDAAGPENIIAVRIGGNDLLNTMGLRCSSGRISHEGPLSYVLNMISSQMMAHGYPVSAPVFDIMDDLETLAREAAEDVERGFVSKTVIHPKQIPIINQALKVRRDDLSLARSILDPAAPAVFKHGGVMCEPATHRNWARRITLRGQHWGEK